MRGLVLPVSTAMMRAVFGRIIELVSVRGYAPTLIVKVGNALITLNRRTIGSDGNSRVKTAVVEAAVSARIAEVDPAAAIRVGRDADSTSITAESSTATVSTLSTCFL